MFFIKRKIVDKKPALTGLYVVRAELLSVDNIKYYDLTVLRIKESIHIVGNFLRFICKLAIFCK